MFNQVINIVIAIAVAGSLILGADYAVDKSAPQAGKVPVPSTKKEDVEGVIHIQEPSVPPSLMPTTRPIINTAKSVAIPNNPNNPSVAPTNENPTDEILPEYEIETITCELSIGTYELTKEDCIYYHNLDSNLKAHQRFLNDFDDGLAELDHTWKDSTYDTAEAIRRIEEAANYDPSEYNKAMDEIVRNAQFKIHEKEKKEEEPAKPAPGTRFE